MGIMCEACRIVHFIATSPGIELSRTMQGLYQLTCKPPCSVRKSFRKDEMRPYRTEDDIFQKGYAEVGEYELIEGNYGRAVV
jgi:hypothetical protein